MLCSHFLFVLTKTSITQTLRESKLIKQFWSSNLVDNDNHILKPQITAGEDILFNNISVEKIKIDGNFLNQYLLQDNVNTTVNRNYAIYFYGSNVIIEDLILLQNYKKFHQYSIL